MKDRLNSLKLSLAIFGKVEICEVKENKLHILITNGFTGNAIKTFEAIQTCSKAFPEYQLMDKCVTDKNKFDLILKS